jgi:hypothetical protein
MLYTDVWLHTVHIPGYILCIYRERRRRRMRLLFAITTEGGPWK